MKKLLLCVLALLVIGGVAFGVRTIGARDETSEVAPKDAASLATDGASSDDLTVGDRPEPGTYAYTGRGSEQVSALGGSEHRFPAKIAVVVQLDPDDDCAWKATVVYVKEHIEERRYCTQDGTVVDRGFIRKIEFFNQLQTVEYTCDDVAERLRTTAASGDTWNWTCTQGTKARSDYTATALGTETLTIGGEPVKTWHTRVVSKQSGDTNGGDTSEFWLAESGLIVKYTAKLEVTTKSVLGDTTFNEDIAYTLDSLVPVIDER